MKIAQDMQGKQEGIKARILGPMVLAIAVLLAAFIFAVIQDQQRDSVQSAQYAADEVRKLLQSEQQQETAVMATTLQAILNDEQLAEAFRRRDRESLLSRSQALFESLSKEHRITHFYFHLPNRENLLRVHRPSQSGDLINRLTLREAERTGALAAGIERGPIGTFVLRVVVPWKISGELIGYVELGMEFEDIVKKLHGLLDVDFIVAVYKKFLDRAQWDKALATYSKDGNWDQFPTTVVMDKTVKQIPQPIEKYLRGIHSEVPGENRVIRSDGADLQIVFLPLNDFSGRTLGELIVLRDVTFAASQAKRSIAIITLVCLTVGAVLSVLFYLFLGKVERDLAGKTAKLKTEIAERLRAEEQLLRAQAQLEKRVEERTKQLQETNQELTAEISSKEAAQRELELTHRKLVETSRLAGMAEVATGVIHNVGNVLNSVNVTCSYMADGLERSRTANLKKVAALLREHEADLVHFLNEDPQGRRIVPYLSQLADHLVGEQEIARHELESLRKHIDHIKDIVAMQQSYARVSGVLETVEVADLVEDALQLNAGSLARHDVKTVKDFAPVPPIMVEKHKVLQILVNLIRNAKYACDESHREDKQLTLRIRQSEDRVRILVTDNGIGIAPQNLTRIFNHGFTTREHGHGFGLHTGALAAKEVGGSLTVTSDGLDKGATFVLELPLNPSN